MSRIADDRYHQLEDDTKSDIEKLIEKNVANTFRVKYTFQGDRKLKALIKVSKIPDTFAYEINSPIIIHVNELLWDALNNGAEPDESLLILFKEAFEGVVIDETTGKAKTSNSTFTTTKGVLKKYNFDDVNRAHQLQEDTLESIKDSGDTIPVEGEIDIAD